MFITSDAVHAAHWDRWRTVFAVKVWLENRDHTLRAGMSTEVTLRG